MDADKGAQCGEEGRESLPLTVTEDGSARRSPNTAIRLGRTLSDRPGRVSLMAVPAEAWYFTSVAPSTGSMTLNRTVVSSCTSYWYGITDEDGKAQLEVTQDDLVA